MRNDGGIKMKTLLKNAFVVTMDEEKGVYSRGCVVVD